MGGRRRTVEVVVPDAYESENDGQVLLDGGLFEVLVHLVRTSEELLKVLVADREGDGQTDGRPERVSSTDPVPELEHVVGRDSELGDGLSVGREGDEVLGNMGLLQDAKGERGMKPGQHEGAAGRESRRVNARLRRRRGTSLGQIRRW